MISDLKERVDAGENEDIVKDAAASVYLGELTKSHVSSFHTDIYWQAHQIV